MSSNEHDLTSQEQYKRWKAKLPEDQLARMLEVEKMAPEERDPAKRDELESRAQAIACYFSYMGGFKPKE